MDHYKARLVMKGFTQEYGIDHEETFALGAHLTFIHSHLTVITIRCWSLFQMDVKNAFLNGDLTENVYMVPSPSYTHPSHQVYRLSRTVYGLKSLLMHGISSLAP